MNADLSPQGFKACLADIEARGERYGVFLGSAISYWKPSSLPTAEGLKDAVLRSLLDITRLPTGLEDSVRAHLVGDTALRLEAVLDDVEFHLPGNLHRYLEPLSGGRPNAIHRWIADLLVREILGAVHTTNQDLLIEKALAGSGFIAGEDFHVLMPGGRSISDALPSVVKLHGSVDYPGSLRTTFTTIGQFGPGPDLLDRLSRDLERMPFVTLGYSGNDIDIRPAFLSTPLQRIYWIGRPGEFDENHFATRLRCSQRSVHLVELDLRVLPELFGGPILENGSREGATDAERTARRLSSRLGLPGRATSTIARTLRHTQKGETVHQRALLRKEALAQEDVTQWSERWIIWWDEGESRLDRTGLFWHNARALDAFRKTLRIAREAEDPFGIASALQGMGMAIDTVLLGWIRWTYGISKRYVYPRAIRVLRHAPPGPRRRVMRDRLDLLYARALLRTNKRGAVNRLRRLSATGDIGHVRGHARRYLAILLSLEGRFDEALELLPWAYEEFEYLVARMETEDYKRTMAKIQLMRGKPDEAERLITGTISAYRAIGKRGSAKKARVLLALLWLVRIFPGIERRPVFRRFVAFC